MSFAKFVVFLAAVASVNGLVTGHAARHTVHHKAIAAHIPESVAVIPEIVKRAPRTRRRCRPRASSTPLFEAPETTTSAASSTRAAPPAEETPDEAEVVAAPAPAPAPAPEPANPPPAGFLSGTNTGEATYYDTGLGACGITNTDTDYIAAVSKLLFDTYPGYAGPGTNPNLNPICGRRVIASYGGKSVTVTITDRCEACAMTDLDFSPAAYNQICDVERGRVPNMKWEWA